MPAIPAGCNGPCLRQQTNSGPLDLLCLHEVRQTFWHKQREKQDLAQAFAVKHPCLFTFDSILDCPCVNIENNIKTLPSTRSAMSAAPTPSLQKDANDAPKGVPQDVPATESWGDCVVYGSHLHGSSRGLQGPQGLITRWRPIFFGMHLCKYVGCAAQHARHLT